MDQEYENILVPMDGSKESELALGRAVAVAKRNGKAHIDVLNVIDTRAMAYNFAGMSDGSIAYQLVDKSKQYLDDVLKRVKDKENFDNIDIQIRLGKPKTIIAFDFVRDHHNDMIMMGASGLSRMQRAIMGSVTSYVKRNAPVDVLVVRTAVDQVKYNRVPLLQRVSGKLAISPDEGDLRLKSEPENLFSSVNLHKAN